MKKQNKERNFTIIMLITITATLLIGACFALFEHFSPNVADSSQIKSPLTQSAEELCDKIYKYKNTSYEDISKINNLLNTLEFIDFEFSDAVLSKNDKNLLILNYKVDSRTNYRIIGDYNNSFLKTSSILFALVDNLDDIRISVSDDYGEFSSVSIQKNMLKNNAFTADFTLEKFDSATKDEESFIEFCEAVLSLNVPVDENIYERKIYENLDSNLELINGSVTEISETVSQQNANFIERYSVDMTPCVNKFCEFKFYTVKDYTTNEIFPYIFIFENKELVSFTQLEDDTAKIAIITNLNK